MAFYAVGRSPIVGIMVAFAASSAGFNASLVLIITAVTEFFLDKKAKQLIDHDDISTEELDTEGGLSLTATETKGLIWSGLALLAFLAIYFVLLFWDASPFNQPGESAMESPLIQAIAVPIAVAFFLVGLTYGLVTGSIKNSSDIPDMMAKGLQTLLPMLVLFFAVSQFLAWFEWSNLGPWTAITGSELLQRWDLPTVVLFAGYVLMVTTLNH